MKVNSSLIDGSVWNGSEVHLNDGQRLSDAINDDRSFLSIKRPAAMEDGKFVDVVLHKDQIAFITEAD